MMGHVRHWRSEVVCFWFCCLLTSWCADVDAAYVLNQFDVDMQSVPSLDYQDLKSYIPPDAAGDFADFRQADGHSMVCFMPFVEPRERAKRAMASNESYEEIFEPIQKTCYYSVDHGSVYEACIGQHIKKLNMGDEKDPYSEVLLANASVVTARKEALDEYVEYYGNGEWCEEADEYNTVEISWRCTPGHQTMIREVYVPIPGHHVLEIETPSLCAHRNYTPITARTRIQCFQKLGQPR